MAKEIERKYLVCGDFEPYAVSSVHICQGYLNPDPDRTVRVRVKGDEAFICVKGRNNGISRFEWEHRIPKEDALSLLPLCSPGVIDKIRYIVPFKGHDWEVDRFFGDNEGLILAELELRSEDETFELPSWIGKEVSLDSRYFNSSLALDPYCNWKDR